MSEPTADPTDLKHRLLRQCRALFVAFHCVAVIGMAIPAPGGALRRSAWKDPTVQGEFEAWTDRLNSAGLDITKDELEDVLWDVTVAWLGGRQKVLAPFGPYYKYAGTVQSWRMFVAPHRYPTRLEIAVDDGADGWEVVYSARSDEHAWRRAFFDHDRMRSAVFRYGWPTYRGTYHRFVAFLADEARTDFPDARRMRVRFYKYRTASPQEVLAEREPEGKWIQLRTVRLR